MRGRKRAGRRSLSSINISRRIKQITIIFCTFASLKQPSMIIEITAPSPGESILEVELGSWLVDEGDHVEKDQEIAEIESDKATLPLVASDSGKISILVKSGESVAVGTILCTVDTSEQGTVKGSQNSNSPADGHFR